MNPEDCIFCNIEEANFLLNNKLAFTVEDKYPHSRGRLLIIPFELTEDYFELIESIKLH